MTKIIFFKLKIATKLLIAIKKPKIVAITGSVGKTSTKRVVAEVLKSKYNVLYQEKSYNTQTGLPLSVFGLESPSNPRNPITWLKVFVKMIPKFFNYPYDVLVLEMGADHPGEIDYLTKLVKPDIGIVIAAHKVHTELFKTLDAIFKEKSILAYRAKKAVINIDEQNLREGLYPKLNNPVSYGQNSSADFRIDNVCRSGTGTLSFDLDSDGRKASINSTTISKEQLLAYSAAAAVGSILEIPLDKIKTSLEKMEPSKGRMSVFAGKNNSLIVDDSYNASPKAVVAGLNNIYEMKGRKIAILGSMNELGDYEEEAHRVVGRACNKLDMLVTVGEPAKKFIASSANKSGLAESKITSFTSPVAAGNFVLENIKKNDIVYIKGSQNRVFNEEAVKILMHNKKDHKHLVRQEEHWMKIKRQQFEDMK